MLTDPIADYLTRVRNALNADHPEVEIPSSRLKKEMTRILVEQGYLNGYDGEPLNKLWDSHTDVFDNRLAGQIGYRVRYLSQGDCISWLVHILGVR